jgi:hypothetical protein
LFAQTNPRRRRYRHPKLPSGPFIGLARKEGADLVVPLSPSSTLTAALAPLVARTLPVVLPPAMAPSHQTRTLRISAPKGYAWAATPASAEERGGEFGSARFEAATDPKDRRVMVVKRTVVFDQHRIAPDRYGDWRAFLARVDRLLHKSVRAVPVEGASKRKAGGK